MLRHKLNADARWSHRPLEWWSLLSRVAVGRLRAVFLENLLRFCWKLPVGAVARKTNPILGGPGFCQVSGLSLI